MYGVIIFSWAIICDLSKDFIYHQVTKNSNQSQQLCSKWPDYDQQCE